MFREFDEYAALAESVPGVARAWVHPPASERTRPLTRVIVESPYAGDVETNIRYLRACMRDCLLRGEAPFASHALYCQDGVLDDDVPHERELGIEAGLLWGKAADVTVVYTDLGISRGMELGIERARRLKRPIEFRQLPDWTRP